MVSESPPYGQRPSSLLAAQQAEVEKAERIAQARTRRVAIWDLFTELRAMPKRPHWMSRTPEGDADWRRGFAEWLERFVRAIHEGGFQANVQTIPYLRVEEEPDRSGKQANRVAIDLLKGAVARPSEIPELVEECGDLGDWHRYFVFGPSWLTDGIFVGHELETARAMRVEASAEAAPNIGSVIATESRSPLSHRSYRKLHGETVNDQMMRIYTRDRQCIDMSKAKWAGLLECSESAIQYAAAWSAIQRDRRERAQGRVDRRAVVRRSHDRSPCNLKICSSGFHRERPLFLRRASTSSGHLGDQNALSYRGVNTGPNTMARNNDECATVWFAILERRKT